MIFSQSKDEQRINYLLEKSFSYEHKSIEENLKFIQEALSLSVLINKEKGIVRAKTLLANNDLLRGNFDQGHSKLLAQLQKLAILKD